MRATSTSGPSRGADVNISAEPEPQRRSEPVATRATLPRVTAPLMRVTIAPTRVTAKPARVTAQPIRTAPRPRRRCRSRCGSRRLRCGGPHRRRRSQRPRCGCIRKKSAGAPTAAASDGATQSAAGHARAEHAADFSCRLDCRVPGWSWLIYSEFRSPVLVAPASPRSTRRYPAPRQAP